MRGCPVIHRKCSGRASLPNTFYKAGVAHKVRSYDLKFAVAKFPKKSVKRARRVLKRFLLIVSKAEKDGITRHGLKLTLSAEDAKKIRMKAKTSFAHYARKRGRSGGGVRRPLRAHHAARSAGEVAKPQWRCVPVACCVGQR